MSIISLSVRDTLGQWLLALRIIGNIQVTGDLEIGSIHVGIDHLDQLPYVGSLLIIYSISLNLWGGGGRVEEPDKGFKLDFSKGSPWVLPLLGGPLAILPRTHETTLDG